MRVLVTGHRGYIGQVLVPRLIEDGHDVVGLDTGWFDACTLTRHRREIPELRIDVRDVRPEHMAEFEAIVHLAALSNDPLGDIDPELTHAINCTASIRLATLAKAAGVRRFLFASSSSVYGGAGDATVDEDSPCGPLTPYAQSKWDAERQIAPLADVAFSPVFLRNGTAYGISNGVRFDLVVNNFTAWAVATGCVRLCSDGSAWRPLVHVDDIALAFASILRAAPDAGHAQVFNVGSTAENYRVLDLAELVHAAVPGSTVQRLQGAEKDRRSYRVDCTKLARAVPDFRPRWTVAEGVAEIIATCRSSAITADEIEGPRYARLAHLKSQIDAGHLDRNLRPTVGDRGGRIRKVG